MYRYEIAGKEMPLMRPWMEQKFGLDLSLTSFSQVGSHKMNSYTCTVGCRKDILGTEESVLVSEVS